MKKALTGLRAWIVQRFTAVYMLLFLVLALFQFAFDPPGSYFAWREWITSPFPLVATVLFFIALLLHAWVGLRDVAMDYVRPVPLRMAVLGLLALVLAGLALWVMQILFLAQR